MTEFILKESNIEKYINDNILKISFSNIYIKMKQEIEKYKSDFHSIKDNYTPIFLYYAMEKGCSLEDFSKILQESFNYEEGLSRFFNNPNLSYQEKDEGDIFDKIGYSFYKEKHNKVFFDEKKIPYIKEIIKNIREKNLLNFHSSGIDFFLSHVIFRDHQIGNELINVISETKISHIQKLDFYPSLSYSIVQCFANSSYTKDISKVYQIFKNNSHFKETIEKNILKNENTVNPSKKGNSYMINGVIFDMVMKHEKDYFDILMQRIEGIKKDLNKKEYYSLIENSIINISEAAKKKPFELNIEKINIEESIIEIMPFLSYLDCLIKNNKHEFIQGKNNRLEEYVVTLGEKMKSYKENAIGLNVEEYLMLHFINLKKMKHFLNLRNVDSKKVAEIEVKEIPLTINKFK